MLGYLREYLNDTKRVLVFLFSALAVRRWPRSFLTAMAAPL